MGVQAPRRLPPNGRRRAVALASGQIDRWYNLKEETPDQVFFDWIRNDGKGYSPPDYALQVSRLSEAVYKAVSGKKPVRVAR